MGPTRRTLASIPLLVRFALVGATFAGTAGGIVGLIIGLHVHAATAPFAVFELGLPSAVVGGVAGLVVGATVWLTHRVHRLHR